MRRWGLSGRGAAVVALLVLGCVSIPASAVLRIQEFIADIEVLESGQLEITETIVVRFFTDHHGIYRWIPVSYRRPTGENISIDLSLEAVTLDGRSVMYKARRKGRDFYLKIGDPDVTIKGEYTYSISYTVDRALLFNNEEYVQLYWNVTGNEWSILIKRAEARVTLPESVSEHDVLTTSYVGYSGSTSRGIPATRDDEGRYVFEATSLSPGEGLTIDIAIPREASGILPPTWGEKMGRFALSNLYALLPILTVAVMLFLWLRRRRDRPTVAIAPRFDVPEGMHAGVVGTLIDDRIDLQDLTAMVIELAVKGYLQIREIVTPPLEQPDTGNTSETAKPSDPAEQTAPDDFEFVKLRDAGDELSGVEKMILHSIFDEAHEEARSLSSLENSFYLTLPSIRLKLYHHLIDKGYYRSYPEGVPASYKKVAAGLFFAAIAGGLLFLSLYLGIAVALCSPIVLAFSHIMPRKTKQGMAALHEVLGLEMYIRKAEVRRAEFLNAPEMTPRHFEKMLPYAIALNLTKIWTKEFEELLEEPPAWYISEREVIDLIWFGIRMAHLSTTMQSAIATIPRSVQRYPRGRSYLRGLSSSIGRSAWSGFSGFGGGSSGGGFGGGGGGGW